MKKKVILIICTLFFLFAILGFFVASWINSAKPQAINAPQVSVTQQNFLLIQVDDLESKSPQLISMWGAFVNNSNPPGIAFVPLFPTANSKIADRLVRLFQLNKQGKLTNNFITRVQQEYQIQTLGYIVIDNYALANLTNSFFSKSINPQKTAPTTAAEIENVLSTGQSYFDLACKKLGKQGASGFIEKIDWLKLLPSHFVTNLSFESFTLATQQLSSIGLIENCVVLGIQ